MTRIFLKASELIWLAAGAVGDVDQDRCAFFVDPVVGVGEDVVGVDALDVFEERPCVADRDAAGAGHGDRLEVLGAHQGARAAAPGLVVLVVRHAGPKQLVLARRTDRQ